MTTPERAYRWTLTENGRYCALRIGASRRLVYIFATQAAEGGYYARVTQGRMVNGRNPVLLEKAVSDLAALERLRDRIEYGKTALPEVELTVAGEPEVVETPVDFDDDADGEATVTDDAALTDEEDLTDGTSCDLIEVAGDSQPGETPTSGDETPTTEGEDTMTTEISESKAVAAPIPAKSTTKKVTAKAAVPAKGAKPAAKSAKAAPRERKVKEQTPCKCGCGELTGGYFRPGHDAKFKGALIKIAKGELKPEAALGAVAKEYQWRKQGDGMVPTKNYKGGLYTGSGLGTGA